MSSRTCALSTANRSRRADVVGAGWNERDAVVAGGVSVEIIMKTVQQTSQQTVILPFSSCAFRYNVDDVVQVTHLELFLGNEWSEYICAILFFLDREGMLHGHSIMRAK